MQITITQDFNNAEDAAAFLARIATPVPATTAPVPTPADKDETAKTPRKPRNDAGKTREPYGPRATTAGEPTPATPTTTAAPTPPQAPASTGTSAAAPSSSAPANKGLATQQSAQGAGQKVAAPAAEEFPATLEGARAAMKKLNDTPSKGMDACIGALKAHGVNRISDLPKEKFAEFIKYVVGQL